MRPHVSVFIATSLDQYIAREDGSIDWLDPVQQAGAALGEDCGYAAFMAEIDMLLMGRSTWDTVLGFGEWPYKGKRVGVLTHRPEQARALAQHGESFHSGPLLPILTGLYAEGVRRIYLDGGTAIRQGLQEGVVDELILTTVPVLLGAGRPLFGQGAASSGWSVVEARMFPVGVAQVRYRRA